MQLEVSHFGPVLPVVLGSDLLATVLHAPAEAWLRTQVFEVSGQGAKAD